MNGIFTCVFSQKGVTPILSAHPPKSTMDRKDGPHSNNKHVRKSMAEGQIQHIGWAYERPNGKGRGFGTTGAHYHHTWLVMIGEPLSLNAMWTSRLKFLKREFLQNLW